MSTLFIIHLQEVVRLFIKSVNVQIATKLGFASMLYVPT
jgi:hypothetical protein